MGIKQAPDPREAPLEGLLEPGERLLWSDRPSYPRALRALGLPPRRPAHLIGLALGLTTLAGLLLAGATLALEAWLRALLLGLGGSATLALGACAAWAWRRHRREVYGLTDRGRVLVALGAARFAFALPSEAALRVDPDGGFGALELGAVPAGAPARLPDLPYPAALTPILNACRAGRGGAPGGG